MPRRRISHFDVLRPLGAGGMGEVLLARDRLLDRQVALKLLPRAAVVDPVAVERFTREAKAASALDHPNIGTIFEIGRTEEGEPFIAMAYYDGGSLAERLRAGPVGVATALSWALQLADGLARAHGAGIVHRDIKPSNLLLTDDGLLKIVDFGIAKIEAATQLTEVGSSPGTPAYMAPEQIRGVAVDARCDLWAVGVVLFELLTGRRPFVGQGAPSVIHNILHGPVPDVRALRPELPSAVTAILGRCLSRHPDGRYASAQALARDLRALTRELGTSANDPSSLWVERAPAVAGEQLAALLEQGMGTAATTRGELTTLASGDEAGPQEGRREGAIGRRRTRLAVLAVAGTLGAVVVGVGLGGFLGRAGDPPPEVPRQISVLPLENLTGDPQLDWFATALSRLVADNLAHGSVLRVSSAPIAGELVGLEPAARASAARQRDVDLLVEGEVLASTDGALAVAHRVTDVESSTELGGSRNDGVRVDLLAETADDLTRQVQMALGLPPEKVLDVYAADFATAKPEAYAAFLDGTERFAEFDYDGAIERLTRALEVDPEFAMARYRLAWALASSGRIEEARDELDTAIAGGSELPERERRYLEATRAYFDYDLEGSIAAWRELLERYPYEIEGRLHLATLLYQSERYDEEIAELETLERLEPGRPGVASMMGEALLAQGAHADAAGWLERYLELDPEAANGHDMLGRAFEAQGESSLAATEFRRALELEPDFHHARIGLAGVLFADGHEAEARAELVRLIEDPDTPRGFRLDAGLDLAFMLRAAGRMRESSALLERLEDDLVAEGSRSALGLVVRADNAALLGEVSRALDLASRAVETAPAGDRRSLYLFHRGRIAIESGAAGAAEQACRLLRAEATSATVSAHDPRTCTYLRGLAELHGGDPEGAIPTLREAVIRDGDQYALYRLGLARAYLAAGRYREAQGAAREILEQEDPAARQLDLAYERRAAELLLAEAQLGLGESAAAAEWARRLLEALPSPDAELRLVVRARQIAAPPE